LYGAIFTEKHVLFALPEYPLGSLLAIAACFGAFFVIKKRSRTPNSKLRAKMWTKRPFSSLSLP
jgi:hypothetical protein